MSPQSPEKPRSWESLRFLGAHKALCLPRQVMPLLLVHTLAIQSILPSAWLIRSGLVLTHFAEFPIVADPASRHRRCLSQKSYDSVRWDADLSVCLHY